ncbi:MAG: 50S ribosomal protein L2 [Thermoplasmata archaeon]|nr:50S ribosomal protein L2 [Thermoplasmata archaeon]
MGKRIIPRRRGHGSPVYRSPSHRHHGEVKYPGLKVMGVGVVKDILHSPAHTAPVAEVEMENGEMYRFLAVDGLTLNSKIYIGENAPIERGNILPLKKIPEGTYVYNIELVPGDGGKLIRAAGSAALVVAVAQDNVVVQLPSGQFRTVNGNCRATVGIVAGAGRKERPFAKAGKKVHAFRSLSKAPFKVRGVAMNPVNHPFGGGSHQHVGRPSTISSGAWPGQKVGRLAPKRKKLKRR